jgi:hypothetical protein
VLTLFKWDGTELTTIDTEAIDVNQSLAYLKVHPITGEIYVIYRDTQLNTGFEYEWNIKRLEGDQWVEPYSSLESLENFEVIDFAFHPVTGDIYIAVQMFIDGPFRGAVITHSQPTDLPEITKAPSLEIYPNPATEELVLDMEGTVGPYTVQIFSVDGRLVKEQQVSNQGPERLEIHDLSTGSYTIKCLGSFGTMQSNFLKE